MKDRIRAIWNTIASGINAAVFAATTAALVFLAVLLLSPETAAAFALLTIVPIAALGLGGALYAALEARHCDEIVIQRGPERAPMDD